MTGADEFSPRVSIIVPVYNGSDYLYESLTGALSQTYRNYEVIVVNDGSDDGGRTERIAKLFGDRIRYYEKPNGGVSSALNYGIERMSGEYFSWLSHDDNYTPEKIEASVEAIRKTGKSDAGIIAFTDGYYINSRSEKIRDFPVKFKTDRIYSGKQVLAAMLEKGTLNGNCMLIPKSAFEKCGLFDESLKYNQDALMWYKIFCAGYRLVCDGRKNVMYRLHSEQTSVKKSNLLAKDSLALAGKILPAFSEISDKEFNPVYLLAVRYARLSCKEAVRECLKYGIANGNLTDVQVMKIKALEKAGLLLNFGRRIYRRTVRR